MTEAHSENEQVKLDTGAVVSLHVLVDIFLGSNEYDSGHINF